ncbi:MFS transporter [Paenibacillus arenilitoris]|uniref:MFS transporter n=1 Tax=Paenibacillus arenilitoris TaxID=2772299 RepID=A0A927H6E2_9BACL|nr:MFS transporter [Paenibacillus arenilitoris]MBD2868474.1 MFS transporter [Paenibacillus arenilitoris]
MKRVVDMSLWSLQGFGKYYLFNLLSYFGSGISIVALPLYIYEQTESPLITSLVSASASLPYLLFGLFAGAFADRGNRKRIMIGCDMCCAILLATVPAAAMLNGHASPWHLLAVSFLTAVAFVGFDSSSHGALLQLVGREKLVAANSLLISSDTVIRIAGPVIAGFIIAAWGAEWAIAVTAVCYLLSGLLIGSIRQSFQTERTQNDGEAGSSLFRRLRADIGEGLSYIWSEPLIRSLTLLGFGNGFVGGAVGGLIVVFGAQALGFADDAPQLGILYTFGSIGALLASLVLPPLRAIFLPGRITIAGLAAGGMSLLGFAMSGGVATASLFYLLWSAASTLIIINGITLRQQLTPDHLQGRVHASGRMIAYGGSPFGSLLGGVAASGIGVQPTYAVTAFVLIVLFAVSLRTPLRGYMMKAE